ncbi:testis-expressed protein 264 homolog [Acipenser ruthenus]|uniref:testis-expressed protein 264 homolog n=1 Tax=Acipenser ruthenus TaxID=7906 RepID=UPI002740A203|nr:testis-expressed protein 264 homolog [Acipenser ruthenus]
MSEFILLALISFLFLFLLLTVLGVVLYSGLFTEVIIRTGSSPIKNITIAYKFNQGSYKDSGAVFTESCSIGPKLSSIGVYYDDPKQVPAEKCRYIAGSVLSEGEEKPSEELLKLYEKYGFKIFSFPAVTHVVMTTFPHNTFLSIFLANWRVYPKMGSYIKERKLCAHPFLELYRGDLIYYICPLARQGDFYVLEMRETERRQKEKEEDSEDRQTDITGADSVSDITESRETSMATSVATSVAPQEQEDDNRSNGSGKGSSDSVGSGSSFEDLDLEVIEEVEPAVVNKGQNVTSEEQGPIPVEGEE